MKKFMAFALTAAMVSSAFGVNALADETAADAEVVAAEETAEEPAEEVTDETAAEEVTEEVVEEVVEEEITLEKEEVAEEAEEETETATPEPVATSELVTPKADVKKDAVLSNAKVAVNGEVIAPQAYTIDGYTYFKLRDVAKAVVGTEAGFSVAWDKDARMTVLTTGAEYTATDAADAKADAGKKVAKLSADAVKVNGEAVVLEAYNIDGYNYYKLRELGETLGFEVTWDKTARVIGINSAVLGAEDVETPADETEVVDAETPAEDVETPADETETPAADEVAADDAENAADTEETEETTDAADAADETPAEDAAETAE